jgi:glycosyltransferase involved in cell wall biosynthesis
MGARIVYRDFDDYASQRNYGLKDISYKHDWVLMLDADEEATPELIDEIAIAIDSSTNDVGMMRMRRKDFFLGKWIKHSSSYPLWFGRLMRPDRVWVERKINEEYHTDAQIIHLQHHINHYPFNKGFSAWLEKHNRYSTMEAELKFQEGSRYINWSGFISRDPLIRRKSLKSLVYSLPGRPVIVFIGLYFVKGGVLEGSAGFTYCVLKTFYEYMISCKLKELRRRKQGLPV